MRRSIIAATLVVSAAVACNQQQQQAAQPPAPAKGSREWKIQSAIAAAPASITTGAAIMEMNAQGGLSPLRPGTNGWTCVADDTTEHHMGALCADSTWLGWFGAWVGHKTPNITKVGTAYMLAGANDASNTNPFATKPDSGKGWVVSGPHLMIVAPGAHPYAGLPTEPTDRSPYVMFANTPYAHLMVPAQAPHAM